MSGGPIQESLPFRHGILYNSSASKIQISIGFAKFNPFSMIFKVIDAMYPEEKGWIRLEIILN